jgi:acyl transferase domain-containing protein/acyl carrier protein
MSSGEGIAVIGLACRFPGAPSADEFWRNLRDGVESITFFTDDELRAAGADPSTPRFVGAKGVLDQADCFDAGFFGVSPREAALMDPQQRIFLETAWTALEDAGYDSRNYPGSIGVFAGSILSIYLVRNLWPNADIVRAAGTFQTAVGNDPTFLATSTSYHLDLRGPSMSVGTACSTSLVAVHLACQSLLSYECDMTLAGGVSVHLPLVTGYRYEDGGILSPDGHCRPFDAAAQGTVSSDGAGVVVLKRLSDAVADGDVIHAVIRGSALNNDGRRKVSYTAPGGPGEAQVIAEALAMAGVAPESVSMIEAHGAGTLLGDPIEVGALLEAFGDCGGKRAFCALGSVKSNIGHVDAAAGVAGLIKTVLALEHRQIPPTLHFQRPNPQIDFDRSPFYVNRDLQPWMSDGPLRAGVSSFGIGGTNVHVVLEEAPAPAASADDSRPFDLVTLSARTPAALEAATDRLADYIDRNPECSLADVAWTLRDGRRPLAHRRTVVCRDRDDALGALRSRDPQRVVTGVAPSSKRPSVAFLFPGLGDHYAGMGWELYCTESRFRETVDRCAEGLKPHLESDVRDFLYAGRDWRHPVLEHTATTSDAPKVDFRAMAGRKAADKPDDLPAAAQPAIFVIELAMAELLRSWGTEPEAMIGHSIGEFVAAHLSGVLSLPDALELVAARARLIQTRVGPGAMLAVPLTEEELQPLLPTGVSLGAVNAARLCIASGEAAAISELSAALAARGVESQRLRSTHAYHSQMMETLVEPLAALLRRVELHTPKIPYVSCITGTWITPHQATDVNYWAHHLCRTVRFQQGLSLLLDEPHRILLEVGPGQGLTSHAIAERTRVPGRENPVIPTMRWSYGRQPELSVLLRGVGQLWASGAPLDTKRFLARAHPRRVQLPTYPFERVRYWIDPPTSAATSSTLEPLKKPDVASWFYLPALKPSVVPPPVKETPSGCLLIADTFGVGAQLAQTLRARGIAVTEVDDGDDLDAALAQSAPELILHLASLTAEARGESSIERFERLQKSGYDSVTRAVQALCRAGLEGSMRLAIVTNELDMVPEKATIRGPAMVASQEHPGLVCRFIETDSRPDDATRRDALVAELLREVLSGSSDPAVVYRGELRYVPSYEPVRLEPVSDERSPFRQHGVYLITGGLGGVGMILAKHLARTAKARLVLVSRSASGNSQEVPELEALGAEVLVLDADVADENAMRHMLETIDARFGELHGVIHAAGAIGVETFREIRQAPAADAESQFGAKVRGLLVLDRVLGDRPLDFCLLLSSLSAVLGGLGFSAYSAANIFMDAFARRKNRWISVDWDSWRSARTRPLIAGLGATVSEFVMEPTEGISACERILDAGNLRNVIVSSGDLQARLRQWISRNATPSVPLVRHERPSLGTAYEAPRGDLERDLAEIWQELFGVSQLGVHDNFFELGGHSLLATQLNARLASKLRVEMSLAELLQAPTIADLAVAIVSHQAELTDPALLEWMLAEVGEDLQNLTAGGGDE